MTDKELGLKVFRSFWKWNSSLHPYTFTLSFDDFLASYGKKADIYLDGVGGGVREAELSDIKIETAMHALASSSHGKIPKNPLVMFQYLSNEAVKIDWIEASGAILADTAEDLLKGAAVIGNSVIFTGKMLTYLLPIIALIVLYYFLNKKTEGQFSKAFKGLKK